MRRRVGPCGWSSWAGRGRRSIPPWRGQGRVACHAGHPLGAVRCEEEQRSACGVSSIVMPVADDSGRRTAAGSAGRIRRRARCLAGLDRVGGSQASDGTTMWFQGPVSRARDQLRGTGGPQAGISALRGSCHTAVVHSPCAKASTEGRTMGLGGDFERQVKKATNEQLKEASREAQQKLDRAYRRSKGDTARRRASRPQARAQGHDPRGQ